MPKRDDWLLLVREIRESPSPLESPRIDELYRLAIADGAIVLASFREWDDERKLDLIHDLLAEKLNVILDSRNPRGLFVTALVRNAISLKRKKSTQVLEARDEAIGADINAGEDGTESRYQFLIDAREAIARLSERNRQIVVAVALGERREDVAHAFGTTAANVDQIISRVCRRFKSDHS